MPEKRTVTVSLTLTRTEWGALLAAKRRGGYRSTSQLLRDWIADDLQVAVLETKHK